MICPKCSKDIGLPEQVAFADKEFYDDIAPPIMLMLDCPHCDEQVAALDISAVSEFEDVESPVLGTVKVPIRQEQQGVKDIKFRAWEKFGNYMLAWEILNNSDRYDLGSILRGAYMNYILMQFTGFTDKNNIEIYEGDIIRYKSFDGKEYTSEVPSLKAFHWFDELEDLEEIEVIGNIYQNPDLLKKI